VLVGGEKVHEGKGLRVEGLDYALSSVGIGRGPISATVVLARTIHLI